MPYLSSKKTALNFYLPSKKEVFFVCIIPIIISACILAFSFKLKQQELIEYKNPTFRITLIFIGMSILVLSSFFSGLFVTIKLAEFIPYKKLKETFIGITAMLLPTIFLLMIGNKLIKMNDRLEYDALRKHGVIHPFEVGDGVYIRGRHSYYAYTFNVNDAKKMSHQLEVTRHFNSLKKGDTIYIVYLKSNPTIFEEIMKSTSHH